MNGFREVGGNDAQPGEMADQARDERIRRLMEKLAHREFAHSYRASAEVRELRDEVATLHAKLDSRRWARRVSSAGRRVARVLRAVRQVPWNRASLRHVGGVALLRLRSVARRLIRGVPQGMLTEPERSMTLTPSLTVPADRYRPPVARLPVRPHPRAIPLEPPIRSRAPLTDAVPPAAVAIRFTGHLEGHYSLAVVNRGLASALAPLLATRGRPLQFVAWDGERYTAPRGPLRDAALARALTAEVARSESLVVSIVQHYPLIDDPEPADIRLMVFVWEETAVPAATVARLNAGFDGIFVASRFVKRALQNSGCTRPITVLHHGLDHLAHPPHAGTRPANGRRRLLHVSSAFERKGVDLLLEAYFSAFSATDPVELYIKTFPNPHNQADELLAQCQRDHPAPPLVTVDCDYLDQEALAQLYLSAAAVVLPSRGEGFNLPAAEAMAHGVPVIVTGHGGQTEFCNAGTASMLPFRFAPSRSHLRSPGACWVEPDVTALREQLQRMVAPAADGRTQARAARGKALLQSGFSWSSSAEVVLGTIDRLVERRGDASRQRWRVAVVSPWNTMCGVADYTGALLQELAADSRFELTHYCDERTVADATAPHVQPGWRLGDTSSVTTALQRALTSVPDVIILQHQPSLFDLTIDLCRTLAAARQQNIVSILELHATLPLLAESRPPEPALAALRQLDRVAVHQVDDLNNLVGLGLSDNLMLLPLGIEVAPELQSVEPTAADTTPIPEDALVLGGFGFLLPHKGIDRIIEAIPRLEADLGRPVHYLACHMVRGNDSASELSHCQALAMELGVSDRVHWLVTGPPLAKCREFLIRADYLLFPYRYTQESASAAIAFALGMALPIIASSASIFADLRDVIETMEGDEVADLVAAVLALERSSERRSTLLARQQALAAERARDMTAQRFAAVVEALLIDEDRMAAATPKRADDNQLLVDVSELMQRDARTGIQRVVRNILAQLRRNPPAGFVIRTVYGQPGVGFCYAETLPEAGFDFRDRKPARECPVTVGLGDIFLGLDLSAHLFPEAAAWLREFRERGCIVNFVIYDLIPLLHPQFTAPGMPQAFQQWMHVLACEADALLCISASVAEDVRHWLTANAAELPWPHITHFPLGADMESCASERKLVLTEIEVLESIAATDSFLMVGTIEPRKGHAQVLAGFETLWERGSDVTLVIVGKSGWMMDVFIGQLRNHSELNRRLFWLESIDDSYLEHIYRAATCLIAASEAEGYGLPLVEAAQRRLPVIARDIPVFQEVAGGHAWFFGGDEPADIGFAVESWRLLRNERLVPKSDGLKWHSWAAATDALVQAMIGSPITSAVKDCGTVERSGYGAVCG